MNISGQILSPEAAKYQRGRSNFIWIILATVVNLVLLAFGGDMYFLFSAAIPYKAMWLGMYFTDRMPADYYIDENGQTFVMGWPDAIFYGAIVVAVVSLALYILTWWLSGKHPGFAVAGTVFFFIDTVAMLLINLIFFRLDFSMLLDLLIHIYMLVILIICCVNGFKARKTPPTVVEGEAAPVEVIPEEAKEETVEELAQTEDNTGNQ